MTKEEILKKHNNFNELIKPNARVRLCDKELVLKAMETYAKQEAKHSWLSKSGANPYDAFNWNKELADFENYWKENIKQQDR